MARQKAEKEEQQVQDGTKIKADPVFYISLVGVDFNGIVEEDEHIFDILTKDYDFIDTDVKVLSAQDLLKFYNSTSGRFNKFKQWLGIENREDKSRNIYNLVQFFIENNPDGNFIIDECPILRSSRHIGRKSKGIKFC